MERSRPGMGGAFVDGIRRAAGAPAVLAGALASILLLSLPTDPSAVSILGAQIDGIFGWWLAAFGPVPIAQAPFAASAEPRAIVLMLVCWSFVSGGILDRYARNRPTRRRAFFGACGAHVGPMLRLGILALAIDLAVYPLAMWAFEDEPALAIAIAVGMAFRIVMRYARVRLVVEDRRSALGAILGSLRFIRRNPATLGLFLLYAALMAAAGWLYGTLAGAMAGSAWLSLLGLEAFIVLQTALVLASSASETALFQGRLAHASYTAAPELVWPESPAAEAIANLSPPAVP